MLAVISKVIKGVYMDIPCKTCITQAICINIDNQLKWKVGYAEGFTREILIKCCILRTWLRRYVTKGSYKEYIKFFGIDKDHYNDSISAYQVKNILTSVLRNEVYIKLRRMKWKKGI